MLDENASKVFPLTFFRQAQTLKLFGGLYNLIMYISNKYHITYHIVKNKYPQYIVQGVQRWIDCKSKLIYFWMTHFSKLRKETWSLCIISLLIPHFHFEDPVLINRVTHAMVYELDFINHDDPSVFFPCYPTTIIYILTFSMIFLLAVARPLCIIENYYYVICILRYVSSKYFGF